LCLAFRDLVCLTYIDVHPQIIVNSVNKKRMSQLQVSLVFSFLELKQKILQYFSELAIIDTTSTLLSSFVVDFHILEVCISPMSNWY
jgi:predicted nuclease of restriction endonuclease-like (RecB) superfamily